MVRFCHVNIFAGRKLLIDSHGSGFENIFGRELEDRRSRRTGHENINRCINVDVYQQHGISSWWRLSQRLTSRTVLPYGP